MKKMGLIGLALVLALGALGVGYALWSQQLTITGSTTTGSLSAGFGEIQYNDMYEDPPGSGFFVPGEVEGKDVASISHTVSEWFTDPITNKSAPTRLSIAITDAYPCYWAAITFRVKNLGTVPIMIYQIIISDPTGELVWDDILKALVNPVSGEEIINFQFVNMYGEQIDPCDPLGEKAELDLHVKQPAIQGHTYYFEMSLRAIQWNEFPQPDSKEF
jgi:hypothetical protein